MEGRNGHGFVTRADIGKAHRLANGLAQDADLRGEQVGARSVFFLFTKMIDLVGAQSDPVEAKIVISPPYTPFAEHEVRYALGLSRRAYNEAVRTGALARSVHFDCRVSPTTALHSLVDVVRFDAMFGNVVERNETPEFAEQCDSWLDVLCRLDEDCERLGRIAILGGVQEIMRLVLPEGTAPVNWSVPAMWHEELIVLSRIVASWCRCYRALHEMLVADMIRCNAQWFGNGHGSGVPSRELLQPNPLAA